jgi:L-iditol 2-dehydrogenase
MLFENTRAVLENKNTIQIILEHNELNDDTFVIKSVGLGVCTSDCKNYKQMNNSYFGHELVGEVITPFQSFQKGDYVLVIHKFGCESCAHCNKGKHHLCESTRSVPTSFSEYIYIPKSDVTQCVYKINKKVDLPTAVFSDSIACVLHAIRKLKLHSTYNILILGNGFMSVLFSLLLKLENIENVTICGANIDKQEIIKPLYTDLNLVDHIQELNQSYDICIDTTGSEKLINSVAEKINPLGQLLLFSRLKQLEPMQLSSFRDKEIEISFSKHFTRDDLQDVIHLLNQHAISVTPLITTYNSLKELSHIMDQTIASEIMRGVILLK